MRDTVRKGYAEVDYEKEYHPTSGVDEFEEAFLSQFESFLSAGASILDIGCGTGVPYDKRFSDKGFDVTGVDITEKHLEKAKHNVPTAKFILSGLSKVDFPPESFDGVVSLYTIFHIPRNEHKTIFKKIHGWLKKGGLLLVTLGTKDEEIREGEFFGSRMAWSSFSIEDNLGVVKSMGFEIVGAKEKVVGDEHNLWILARKAY